MQSTAEQGYDSDDQCDCNCDCALPPGGVHARSALPLTYYLELTPECNNRCPGCGNIFVEDAAARSVRVREAWLDLSHWVAILDRIGGHAQRVQLTGGEPTCHPEFELIVRQLAARRLPFTLFTNGRWRNAAGLVAALQASGWCRGMLISLHGATSEAHEAFSGIAGSFDETCRNVRLASAAGLAVALSTVFTRQNLGQLGAVVALARELGARQVVFNRYLGCAVPAITVSPTELRRAVQTVEGLRAAGEPVKFGACIPSCFTASTAHGCGAGATFATVDPWGRLRPCNHSPLVIGSLLRQPVEALWASPQLDGWDRLLPERCRPCALFTTCHGGCRAVAMQLNLPEDPLIRRPRQSPRATTPWRRP